MYNQAFFTKIYIDEGDQLRVENNRPFEILLDPQINANALTWTNDSNKARTEAISDCKGSSPVLVVALAQYTHNTPVELRPPAARLTGRPVITKRRATKRVRQRVVELYQSGRSARYVAGEVGVSRTTVLNILIQSGVERRPVGPVPRAI